MTFLVGLAVGGLIEDSELRIEDVEMIEAEDIYKAKSKYDKKHNCSFYYGKTIGIVDGDATHLFRNVVSRYSVDFTTLPNSNNIDII